MVHPNIHRPDASRRVFSIYVAEEVTTHPNVSRHLSVPRGAVCRTVGNGHLFQPILCGDGYGKYRRLYAIVLVPQALKRKACCSLMHFQHTRLTHQHEGALQTRLYVQAGYSTDRICSDSQRAYRRSRSTTSNELPVGDLDVYIIYQYREWFSSRRFHDFLGTILLFLC